MLLIFLAEKSFITNKMRSAKFLLLYAVRYPIIRVKINPVCNCTQANVIDLELL